MNKISKSVVKFLIYAVFLAIISVVQAQPLRVVTTLTDYAWLTEKIGGEFVEVKAIVQGNQDAHFIRPKPSFVELLRNADMLVATGLDLEMWLPSAVDKSGNRKIRSGESGYVSAATGMNLKDKPVALSHIEGGLHLYGNPHVTVSALNMIQAADNIRVGLSRNLPGQAEKFRSNYEVLVAGICNSLYGAQLVEMLGQKTLLDLHKSGKLLDFLSEKKFKGQTLDGFAGGWLARMLPLRGAHIVCYHKNWLYFFDDFGLVEGGFIEPKPGVPPSPRHLSILKENMKKQDVKIVISADYFDEKTVRQIAAETGAIALMLPYYVNGRSGLDSWLKLMDFWVESLVGAAEKAGISGVPTDAK